MTVTSSTSLFVGSDPYLIFRVGSVLFDAGTGWRVRDVLVRLLYTAVSAQRGGFIIGVG